MNLPLVLKRGLDCFPKLFERITALILLLRQGLVRHISLVFADPRQRCGHFISFWAFSITPFDPEFRTHKHTDYLLNVLLTLHVDTWSDFQHFPFMPLRGFTNTLQQKIRQNQKKQKKRKEKIPPENSEMPWACEDERFVMYYSFFFITATICSIRRKPADRWDLQALRCCASCFLIKKKTRKKKHGAALMFDVLEEKNSLTLSFHLREGDGRVLINISF